MRVFFSVFFLTVILCTTASGQVLLDAETGMTSTGYNDIRIPGTNGTDISFTNDLSTEPAFFYRLRAGYTFNGSHTLVALVAPLKLKAYGTLGYLVSFAGTDFSSGTPLTGTYVFNSYRFTYRYGFIDDEHLYLGAGLTGKIRDASIQLEGGGRSARKTNLGFVPLINFYFDWQPLEHWGLIVEGDALAAPQGRAEDVFAGIYFYADRFLHIKAGYRVLEGGADNDEVYNFTLVHYAVIGGIVRF